MEREAYFYLLLAWAGVAACVFIALQFFTAPYGRHARAGWGPTIHRTAGWVIMESPAVFVFVACFVVSDRRRDRDHGSRLQQANVDAECEAAEIEADHVGELLDP